MFVSFKKEELNAEIKEFRNYEYFDPGNEEENRRKLNKSKFINEINTLKDLKNNKYNTINSFVNVDNNIIALKKNCDKGMYIFGMEMSEGVYRLTGVIDDNTVMELFNVDDLNSFIDRKCSDLRGFIVSLFIFLIIFKLLYLGVSVNYNFVLNKNDDGLSLQKGIIGGIITLEVDLSSSNRSERCLYIFSREKKVPCKVIGIPSNVAFGVCIY